MNRKQKIIVSVVGITIVLLALLGITYAYYLTRIQGNTNTNSISITTADLKLEYGDGNGIVTAESIMPGTTLTPKVFEVSNEGNTTASYSVVIDNVENNFERTEDWTYNLERSGEIEPVATGTIKRLESQILLSNIPIAVDETHTYTLTITYENPNVDQSIDMGKSLSLRTTIRDVSEWERATEGTLLYAIKKDNNIVDKRLVVESNSENAQTQTISNIDYYITYGTGYEFNNGSYNLTGVSNCKWSECYQDLVGKYVGAVATNLSEENMILDTEDLAFIYKLESTTSNSYTYLIKNKKEILNVDGLSNADDDYGISYYYRGTVENNFVTFDNKCWRIVRVLGDGKIKLVLADENNPCSANSETGYSTLNTDSAFINSGEKTYYATWLAKYEESNISNKINTWLNNISSESQDKLAETYWCNDYTVQDDILKINYGQDIVSLEKFIEFQNSENYSGGAYNLLDFGPYFRKYTSNPSYKCNQVSNSELYFNKVPDSGDVQRYRTYKIQNKIGMLTSDEILFANEGDSYLVTNAVGGYFTMSPKDGFLYGNDCDWVFVVDSDGTLNETGTSDFETDTYGFYRMMRPAITLKSNVEISEGGLGTQEKPYIIAD